MNIILILLIFSFCYSQDHCVKNLCPPGEICMECNFMNTSYTYCFALTCSCTSYDNCTIDPSKIISYVKRLNKKFVYFVFCSIIIIWVMSTKIKS